MLKNMYGYYIPIFIILIYLNNCNCFINVYKNIKQEIVTSDPGDPLFLTPFIKAGKIQEAQIRAEVKFNNLQEVESYAGYLTVDEKHGSNMFFWFFPCQADYRKAPVVLWLQGGPGATSLIGLFVENGPLTITKNMKLKLRKYSWTTMHSIIYIDNPVGTGYSFTTDGYATDEVKVGADLYNALLQFFQLFPELQQNDFYVTGESYGGKYVPAVAYTIHQNNPSAKQKINMRGLSIGNGFSDPENQVNYSDYLYQLGLIDLNAKNLVKTYEQEGINYIRNKQWLKAFFIFDSLIDGDLSNKTSLFQNITGFTNYYNYLVSNDTSASMEYMGKFIQNVDVRRAIHVGNSTFNGIAHPVEINLMQDVMQSVAPWISELLSHYRVLIYNGQLDIIVAYPLTVNYLQKLKFSASDEYKTATRHVWYVLDELAGYVKQAGNLTEILVRNAGHMVPSDQPKWTLDMITKFTHNRPFY